MTKRKITHAMFRHILKNDIEQYLMEPEQKVYAKAFDKLLVELKQRTGQDVASFIYKGLVYVHPESIANLASGPALPKELHSSFAQALSQKNKAAKEVGVATRSLILAVPFKAQEQQVVRDSLPFDLYNDIYKTNLPRIQPLATYVKSLSLIHRANHENALQVVQYYQALRMIY